MCSLRRASVTLGCLCQDGTDPVRYRICASFLPPKGTTRCRCLATRAGFCQADNSIIVNFEGSSDRPQTQQSVITTIILQTPTPSSQQQAAHRLLPFRLTPSLLHCDVLQALCAVALSLFRSLPLRATKSAGHATTKTPHCSIEQSVSALAAAGIKTGFYREGGPSCKASPTITSCYSCLYNPSPRLALRPALFHSIASFLAATTPPHHESSRASSAMVNDIAAVMHQQKQVHHHQQQQHQSKKPSAEPRRVKFSGECLPVPACRCHLTSCPSVY